jgi:DNA-binding protein HU-beta
LIREDLAKKMAIACAILWNLYMIVLQTGIENGKEGEGLIIFFDNPLTNFKNLYKFFFLKEEMNKAELVSKMAELVGVTKVQVERGLSALIQAITEAVEKGSAVKLVGFGTFEVVRRAKRKGRNPRTGEPLKIEEKKVVRFRAGKRLKEAVLKS